MKIPQNELIKLNNLVHKVFKLDHTISKMVDRGEEYLVVVKLLGVRDDVYLIVSKDYQLKKIL